MQLPIIDELDVWKEIGKKYPEEWGQAYIYRIKQLERWRKYFNETNPFKHRYKRPISINGAFFWVRRLNESRRKFYYSLQSYDGSYTKPEDEEIAERIDRLIAKAFKHSKTCGLIIKAMSEGKSWEAIMKAYDIKRKTISCCLEAMGYQCYKQHTPEEMAYHVHAYKESNMSKREYAKFSKIPFGTFKKWTVKTATHFPIRDKATYSLNIGIEPIPKIKPKSAKEPKLKEFIVEEVTNKLIEDIKL